ncbi:MAG: hypothetical protein ABEJ75_00325 [Candidatus Nanohaloarchaea archaeon]
MSTVLETSDLHLEEQDQESKEDTLERLLTVAEDADEIWAPGDIGDVRDWNMFEETFSEHDIEYSLGNMDTKPNESYHADRDTVEDVDPLEDPKLGGSGVKTDDVTDFVNNIKLFEEKLSGNGYNVMFSHNPKHVGIDSWNEEFIPDEENDRGRATADHPFYDIIVTAHYHNGGAYVNENGALVVKSPSARENYKEGAPERTSQLIEFSEDYINVREVDLDSPDGEPVYEKTFRYDGEGFEEIDPREYLE